MKITHKPDCNPALLTPKQITGYHTHPRAQAYPWCPLCKKLHTRTMGTFTLALNTAEVIRNPNKNIFHALFYNLIANNNLKPTTPILLLMYNALRHGLVDDLKAQTLYNLVKAPNSFRPPFEYRILRYAILAQLLMEGHIKSLHQHQTLELESVLNQLIDSDPEHHLIPDLRYLLKETTHQKDSSVCRFYLKKSL